MVAAVVLAVGGGALVAVLRGAGSSQAGPAPAPCDVPFRVLQRVSRGFVPNRSGDVLAIENPPNQFGTRHSTPWPYTQRIPLVLYGPGYIRSGVTPARDVTLADLAPTFARLLHWHGWPQRNGRALREALLPRSRRNGIPRLVFTVVWDGGGDNVLQQWPDSWPNLHAVMTEGASYTHATVGSSPSITPATHATLGTGAWPSVDGLADTKIRVRGRMVDAWQGTSPRYLRVKTFADLWDSANGNRPLVGLLARDAWHLGMLGHGAELPEGDRDIAVLDDLGGTRFRTNQSFYSLPGYLKTTRGLGRAVETVDVRDGQADGRWLGNPLVASDPHVRYTPAWSIYQTRKIIEVLARQGFGADAVPDLFFTNYKSTDLAGHQWNMVEPEERDDLQEQDRQLHVLITSLDRLVGRNNYVLAMTADHGQTPYTQVTGGWSIDQREMEADVEETFDKVTPKVPLVIANRGYALFLDHNELERNGIAAADIAAYLRNYRIRDNVRSTSNLPAGFEARADERLFATALTPAELDSALACARRKRASRHVGE